MGNGTEPSWERIQSILELALEREPDDVATYLDQACGGDADLRAEVESLIAADRRAPALLDRRTFHLTDPPATPVPLEDVRLGAFRVVHEIGRGGMSVVYLGERADSQFERRVAIKVLQQDARAAGMAERFRMERQILGSLDHRGIVRILDGGTTGDGRPYLVMEHIEGERIDTWCDRHRLTIEQRLALFGQVLHAVAYAHRTLVVHRDLKPDNILVTEDGEVRLLDFGIAKLLDRGTATDTTLTRTGLRAMTPEYASPEQIRGEHITTASDIYALGVLLFQLLTGQRPYALEAATPWAVERAVLESEPDRPSTAIHRVDKPGDTADARAAARRTEPDRLRTMLDGDLDAIVLKALRKEPDERYGSADAFREDIERYLGSQPVLARRGTRWYRARKFVRRHRAGVAVCAAVAMVLLGSTAAIASSRNVAETARATAEREAHTAREVTDFLIAVFGGSNPFAAVGDTVSARTLLEQGRERIGRELHDAPLVRASLLDAMGRVYTGLGRFETADSLLQQALQLRTEILGLDDIAVAQSFQALGRNASRGRDYPSALSHLERAASILAADAADHDDGRQADLLADLVTPLRELGHVDSAYALVQRALALDRARGDSLSVGQLGRRVQLATVLRAKAEYDAASQVYADLLPAIERAVGETDPLYSVTLNNAAFLLVQQQRWAEAVPLYRKSIDLASRILGPDHDRVLIFQQNLAGALANSGEADEALRVLNERLEVVHRLWPNGHWRIGSAEQGIGKLLLQMERHTDAEAAFRAAVASFHGTIGPANTWSLVAETWVVMAMTLRGDARGAELLDRAIVRLAGAPLDGDTRADIGRIADRLEEIGMTPRAQRFRALLEAPGA